MIGIVRFILGWDLTALFYEDGEEISGSKKAGNI
jgi:hypothetical protein